MNILVAQIVGVGPNINSLMLDTLQSIIDKYPEANIYHLSCSNTFSTCNANPHSNPAICYRCVKALNKGRRAISGKFTPITIEQIITKEDSKLAKKFISEIQSVEKELFYENYKVGESAISTYISSTRDRDLEDIGSSFVLKYMENGIALYNGLGRFFEDKNIDLVYNFNGRHAYQRAVMSVAEKYGKVCHNMEMARHGGFLESFENSLPQTIKVKQKIIQDVWDKSSQSEEEKERIAISFFEKKIGGEEVHGGVFIQNQKKNQLPKNIDYSKKNYVIYTSSDDEFAAVGKEWENPYFKDQNEGIFYIAEIFGQKMPDSNLFIRMHPNMGGIDYEYAVKPLELKGRYPNVNVISPSSDIDSYALMNIADTVIVFGSSIAIEANFWRKPVILLAKTFYSGMGIAFEPDSKDEIESLLQSNLSPRDKSLSLIFGYYFLKGGVKAQYFRRDADGKVYFKNQQLNELTFFEKIKSKLIQELDKRAGIKVSV